MFAPSLWFHLYKDRKAALASASAKAKAKAVPAPVWYWASFSFMVDVYCTFPWQFHGFSNTSLMCMHSGSGPPRHRRGSSRPGVLVSSCINQWMCVLCYIPLYLCLLCCRVAGLSILHDRRVIKWFVFRGCTHAAWFQICTEDGSQSYHSQLLTSALGYQLQQACQIRCNNYIVWLEHFISSCKSSMLLFRRPQLHRPHRARRPGACMYLERFV